MFAEGVFGRSRPQVGFVERLDLVALVAVELVYIATVMWPQNAVSWLCRPLGFLLAATEVAYFLAAYLFQSRPGWGFGPLGLSRDAARECRHRLGWCLGDCARGRRSRNFRGRARLRRQASFPCPGRASSVWAVPVLVGDFRPAGVGAAPARLQLQTWQGVAAAAAAGPERQN